jgi:hypothetical protein
VYRPFRAAEAALAFNSCAPAYFYARNIATPNSDWLGSGQMPLETLLLQQSARLDMLFALRTLYETACIIRTVRQIGRGEHMPPTIAGVW